MEAQMRLFFFFIVMISAATEEIYLSATEGGNITLPDPVLENGYIIFKGKLVAMEDNGSVRMRDLTYTNRLHWDKNTGLFTITGLKMNDSGSYTIGPNEGNIVPTSYILTVYDPVPGPAVNTVSVSTESCILLCSVDKAETTLLWYKDEEILNQSSSALSLPLTVHKQDFNSSYRCVAANPAEHKTLHVNITTSCWNITDNTEDTIYRETHSWLFLIPMNNLKSMEEIRRLAVTPEELDKAIEGHQPSSRTSICSFVLHEGGMMAPHPAVRLDSPENTRIGRSSIGAPFSSQMRAGSH
ncbi:CD48 antigen-like [Scomber japonicus]|uniref:CD48 antigen-like n=1 Tax=Scomber japonicus TaxID=13676 RepID=UPI002304DCC4|nr:CD48 antigen-like [Scomber japonicus]